MRLPASRALEKIQKGSIATSYLLLGTEIYWRDRIWSALRTGFGDTGIYEFDLKQTPLERVLEEAQSRSLLSPRQLLLVRNAQNMTAARGGTGNKGPALLGEYFKDPNPDSTLVFEMMDVDLDSDNWREREKAKSLLEAFGVMLEVVLLTRPSAEEAVALVIEEAAAKGTRMETEAAQKLALLLDRDMGRIAMEIDKLCSYKEKEETIKAEDVILLAAPGQAGAQTTLAEAIQLGKVRQALEALGLAFREGTYGPLLLGEISRSLRQMILLKESKARDSQQASQILWSAKMPAPNSLIPAILRRVAQIPRNHLLRCLRLIYQAEIALRSGPPEDRIIIEQLILRISHLLQPKLERAS